MKPVPSKLSSHSGSSFGAEIGAGIDAGLKSTSRRSRTSEDAEDLKLTSSLRVASQEDANPLNDFEKSILSLSEDAILASLTVRVPA